VGEVGVLTHVGADSERGNRCYLHIAYNGKLYVGSLLFDDRAFCMFVGNLLKNISMNSSKKLGIWMFLYAL
jgi:hypothetical protein